MEETTTEASEQVTTLIAPVAPAEKPKRSQRLLKEQYVSLYTQQIIALHEKDIKIAKLNAEIVDLLGSKRYPDLLHFVALFIGIVCGALVTLLFR